MEGEEDAVLGLTLELGSAVPASVPPPPDHWAAFDALIRNEAPSKAPGNDGSHDVHGHVATREDDKVMQDNDEQPSGGALPSDAELLRIKHKAEAKQLGEAAYKRWKKVHKSAKKSHKDDKSKHKHRHGTRGGQTSGKSRGGRGRHASRSKSKRHHKHEIEGDDEGDVTRSKGGETRKQRRISRKRPRASDDGEDESSAQDHANAAEGDNPAFMSGAEAAAYDPMQMTSQADGSSGGRQEGGDGGVLGTEGSNASGEAARRKAARLEALRQSAAELKTPRRVVQAKEKAYLDRIAVQLVEAMRNARAKDDLILARQAQRAAATTVHGGQALTASSPPLNKVALRDAVVKHCLCNRLLGPLINASILQELSYWVYDFDRNEPAAFELRTTALDLLLRIPIEGELDASRARDRHGNEDLTVFTGLSEEHLLPTNLGRAVNALRLHHNEVAENHAKCVQLLERFSRAMAGGVSRGGRSETRFGAPGGETAVTWKCQGDRGVASPFEVVQTSSDAFQRAFMQPDPRDPTSYHNLLPWRPPVKAITNLSGQLAEEIRTVDLDHADE